LLDNEEAELIVDAELNVDWLDDEEELVDWLLWVDAELNVDND